MLLKGEWGMAGAEHSSNDVSTINLGGLEPKDRHICVFVPSLSRDEQKIDHELWRNETIRLMSKLFGGATTIAGIGGWLDVEQGGKIKQEPISVVVSFITGKELITKNMVEFKDFLYRMGREAKQGEIGYLVDGVFYRIRNFGHE
jgi:hypothetical protein